jgi:hypothetical protein
VTHGLGATMSGCSKIHSSIHFIFLKICGTGLVGVDPQAPKIYSEKKHWVLERSSDEAWGRERGAWGIEHGEGEAEEWNGRSLDSPYSILDDVQIGSWIVELMKKRTQYSSSNTPASVTGSMGRDASQEFWIQVWGLLCSWRIRVVDFNRYAQECGKFVSELRESLTVADVNELRKDCAHLGVDGWDQWFFENLHQISAFVAATSSERETRNVWQDPVLKRHLVLASIQQLTRACNLLEGIHRYGLSPGLSYRKMAAKAADAYLEIFLKQPASDWPFDGPDPFGDR